MSGDGTAPGRVGRHEMAIGVMVLAFVGATLVGFALGVRHWNDDPPGVSLVGAEPVEIAPPVPLTGGEAYVLTEVLTSGDLVVTQWIESSQPLESVLLARPDVAGADRLAADHVRVVADGKVVSGPGRVSVPAVRYRFPGASSVQIKYRLNGAVESSESAPGRALAWSTALDVSYEPATQRVTRTVIAREVLSLACSPPVTDAPPAPCGTRRSDREWTVELDGSSADDRVIAALTLS